jgi:arsenite methyltransferase
MSSRTDADTEMFRAESLPQADASSLVDADELEAKVKDMYGRVAREEAAALHFEVGRELAEHLGYPRELLDAIPAEALASFAGVGHHLDLAALAPGEAVLDLGCGSGTDVFCAPSGSVRGDASSASTSRANSSRRPSGCASATASRRSSSSRPGSTRCRSRTARSTQ